MTIQHEIGYGTAANRPPGALALEDRFEILKHDIGDGSFGSVSQARVRTAGAHVARRGTTVRGDDLPYLQCLQNADHQQIAIKTMKKTFDSFAPCLELREVVFLRTLPNHAHLVPALDIFLDPYSKKLHICMEHMDGNLYQLMKARDHKPLDGSTVKSILFQILSGLEHIHAHHFFHRDVKPENILVSNATSHSRWAVDPATGGRPQTTLASPAPTPPGTPPVYTVKIADFGLARETHSKLPYTTYVSTRWYRAPEVLLRAGQYSAPVDIWALGAMAVEVATLKPLFPGSNEVDQVWRVCEIMGSPGNWYSRMGGKIGGGEWPEGTKLAAQLGFSFPKMAPHSLETILQPAHWPSQLSDLVTWCLMWDPKNRPTSTQALNHPYFDDAFDPLRPKSAASRILSRKKSDMGLRSRDADAVRPLNSKPSWFRRSLVGRDSNTHIVPQVVEKVETKVEPPQATAPTPASNASSTTKVRPHNEKRLTWGNGAAGSTAAPMPILPTIRPISPLSDAVTAQASARPSKDSPPSEKDEARRRRAELEDKAVKKIGRQLSVASTGNHYADVVRQETERALNGNSGLVSPPSGHKESFFSHLRKRARRLSGRNQLSYMPGSDDLESGAGCGPWSSNRSSMMADPPATILTLESQDSPLEKALQSVRYSTDLSSPSGVGKMRASGSESSIQKSLHSLSHEHSARGDADGPAIGPVSSRTRRALQRSSHLGPRYETPDEQEELLDEMVHMANTAALRLDRKPVPGSDKALKVPPHKESTQRSGRQPLRDLELTNPYPTPSPSGKREGDYFSRRESAAQVSPIAITKPSGYSSNRAEPKWPTPPYEENEWAAAAAASIYAAGAAYR